MKTSVRYSGRSTDFYITWSSLRFVISWSNDILSFNAQITEISGHIVKGKHFKHVIIICQIS